MVFAANVNQQLFQQRARQTGQPTRKCHEVGERLEVEKLQEQQEQQFEAKQRVEQLEATLKQQETVLRI
ncbi:hypothetical protein M378DRAFT_998393 [Amanita muscaria Koide BX008]|uniref:Uncharacterized protein n=1 Tax=Amanita muscaria (strain Koide BX008) TaxID=946122 RepID=A0A0C2WTG4_AMAMK|nr:hypothetical protein M378DRAFT_998393 [Amanita muscaria Koide BX008]